MNKYCLLIEDQLGISFQFLPCQERSERGEIGGFVVETLRQWMSAKGIKKPAAYIRFLLEMWKNIFDHAGNYGQLSLLVSPQTKNMYFVAFDENTEPVDFEWASKEGNSTSKFLMKDMDDFDPMYGGNGAKGIGIILMTAEEYQKAGELFDWYVNPSQGITYSGSLKVKYSE